MGKTRVVLRELKLTNKLNINYTVWVSAADETILRYQNYKKVELTGESRIVEVDYKDKRVKLKRSDFKLYYKKEC